MESYTNKNDPKGASTSTETRHDGNAANEDDEMWEDSEGDICLLCNKPNDPVKSTVVKKVGIKRLIQASNKRKDGKHLKLQEFEKVTVHKSCQTMYTRDSNIKISLKKSTEAWRNNRRQSEDGRTFDNSINCFFCSNCLFKMTQKCKRVTKQNTIDNIISQLEVYPKTESNKLISSRLDSLRNKNDDYYIDNNVSYHQNCLSRFYKYRPCNVHGRPISDSITNLLSFIINYILENSDDSQVSLKVILEEYISKHGQTDLPRLDRIEELLKQHFGDEIVIYATMDDRFICFKQTLEKNIEEKWYSSRNTDERGEKLRIVELAAHIILQDIRAMKCDTENYNSPTDFVHEAAEGIPETLKLFLDILIKTHKCTPKNESWAKWENRIVTAAHILISSVRPRSFTSPILLGLSSMIYTKFAARGLIDCLNNIGLCASYSETVRFENSIINCPPNLNFDSDTYLQFVYDNADHNTATIDGKNTFHCMGGIMCVTPSTSVSFEKSIPRFKGTLSANTNGTYGFLPLTDFKNNKPFKLDSVIINNWKETDRIDFTIQIEPIDLLYFYGKFSTPQKTPNWHGFMNKYHALNTDFCTTRVIALPFIKAPPSDHTTILTALIDARKRANRNNQKHCFVTFDLPLYMKASEIVASIDPENDIHNIRSIIPRLGGFHLLTSFLGSIGNIMAGSGLKEAFSTIYAELSVDKALAGRAFSRAVRGHLLVQAALAVMIYEKMQLTADEKVFLDENLKKIGEETMENILVDPLMKDIQQKFLSTIDDIEKIGPTSQLWVQYFKLICLVQRYIDAERSGNFNLHLQTIQLMIPFFFASGHHLYAKACLLYLQQMLTLKNVMEIFEYDTYCKRGFSTIRRSNRFWSGVWSDMTIEQVLMRAIKCNGGLTHGRNLTENVIGKWVGSRATILEMSNAIELFCNVTFATTEQHVDNRISRMSRDAEDLVKVQQFFKTYYPFQETDKIVGIYSGLVGDLANVNCHRAFEIGKVLMDDASNKKFTDIKYKRSSKMVHLAAANSTMKNVAHEEMYISPLLLFQKISLNIQNQDDMKEYCSSYELSTIPLSLFDENGMRKTTKSTFYSNFDSTHEITTKNSITHVVDGGFFLHKVVWQSNAKIHKIVSDYVSYAENNYGPNSFIVFDGYPEDDTISTKSVERSRRHSKNIGREIVFDENTIITINQKQFLSNEKNKCRLIDLISNSLKAVGFRTKIAPEDADRLIVLTALDNARIDSEGTFIIVGEDVDLLVIFSQLAENLNNIYFRKENKGSKANEFYSSNSFKHFNLRKIVAFLHAFSGCDTTSCFFKIGKNKLIESFPHEKLTQLASVFYDQHASCEKIASSAFELIRGMYASKGQKIIIEKSNSFSLNDLRYFNFSKVRTKSSFAFETLPPTEGAAKQHAFRVFYQLHLWLGNTDLRATDWGWEVKENRLIPIGSTDPPIPQQLLNHISCSCSKKGCIDASCSCKKHGLHCTNLCAHCHESSCFNLSGNELQIESDDDCEIDENDLGEIDVPIEHMSVNKFDDESNFSKSAKRKRLL